MMTAVGKMNPATATSLTRYRTNLSQVCCIITAFSDRIIWNKQPYDIVILHVCSHWVAVSSCDFCKRWLIDVQNNKHTKLKMWPTYTFLPSWSVWSLFQHASKPMWYSLFMYNYDFRNSLIEQWKNTYDRLWNITGTMMNCNPFFLSMSGCKVQNEFPVTVQFVCYEKMYIWPIYSLYISFVRFFPDKCFFMQSCMYTHYTNFAEHIHM